MAGDQHAAHELELYLDNTEAYYRQKIAIFTNYAKKKDKGIFDYEKGIKGFVRFVAAGARQYMREFGGFGEKVGNVFDVFTRKLVCENYVKEFGDWYKTEWPSLRGKKK